MIGKIKELLMSLCGVDIIYLFNCIVFQLSTKSKVFEDDKLISLIMLNCIVIIGWRIL